MNAVGIDVSKGKSMIAVLQPMGKVVVAPHEVAHTSDGFHALIQELRELPGETRAILEHTGRYYEPVAKALTEAGIYVSAVNPCLIRDYGEGKLRRGKTDKKDSLKIAKFGLDNWHLLPEYVPMDAARQQLKNLSRQLALYTKTKVALKNNLIALLDQTFPGVNALFDSPARPDGHQKWVDFADTFWHADCITSMSEKAFAERYCKWCKSHRYNFSAAKASVIYSSAHGQIIMLPKNADTKLLVHSAVSALQSVSQIVETFRAQMLRLAQTLPEYSIVMAMFGVGDSIGPQLMAEIGDVRRFAHRGALIAYAGVDPQPSQSGKQDAKSGNISRKGHAGIRKALYQVMTILLRRKPVNDPVYQFLDKKRGEGKPYFVYMTAGANKFLRIYYARVREHLKVLDKVTMS